VDYFRYKYLLNSRHIRISINSTDSDLEKDKLKFVWFASDMTESKITIQILFNSPIFISFDRKMPNFLNIKFLPDFLLVKSK